MATDSRRDVVIIGGGPAGLTAGYELLKRSDEYRPLVFEAGDIVGGIARTESYKGYRFDIGGHRFFTKVGEVEEMWREVLKDEFITVPRQSRIYYRGRYFDYPLRIFNALSNIGVYESGRILLSYLKWRVKPHKVEDSFEEWVQNRFGGRLYMHFFRSYTEKVWGIPPKQIRADWAAQRIKNLSLLKAVWNAISGSNDTASLIEEFQYPRLGPGQMWEVTSDHIDENGGAVEKGIRATRVLREDDRVTSVEFQSKDGEARTVQGDQFINSMALKDLIEAFDPPPPQHVRDAAAKLKYRDFLIVTLVLNSADPFPDNWIYVHSPAVKVGRIQNFRAWSPDMLPDPDTASIGMEYFCQEGDGLWTMSDEDLRALATKELAQLGLAKEEQVVDAAIIRQPKAYPVYDGEYKDALDTIAEWIDGLENFQTVGRNGLHRYNNQDHSMLSAMFAARNILGEKNDVWNVNVERSYHEEFELPEKGKAREKVPA
ncbi:NAD(P)/FAD-dependent oxidoreductase [Erythrobacter litoralis]|uniref:NAD(P)/FAD-dependent oxidoreductase n=1 Tax=Erythrobacter litoralis TaxID=39960 RepID=UPI00243552E3|nr:NAD(P)/FAD-dependent oxidoreductase [Erythrobacter litoralis]MDG6078809.1 NAD(P)/FAD-dependent oxidoreductase [Erythrobacter litoralis]